MRGFQERSAEWPSAILIGAQVTEFKKTCLLWGVKTHGAAFNPIEPGETAGLANAKTSVCQPFWLALNLMLIKRLNLFSFGATLKTE
jgi:hypothetical protein